MWMQAFCWMFSYWLMLVMCCSMQASAAQRRCLKDAVQYQVDRRPIFFAAIDLAIAISLVWTLRTSSKKSVTHTMLKQPTPHSHDQRNNSATILFNLHPLQPRHRPAQPPAVACRVSPAHSAFAANSQAGRIKRFCVCVTLLLGEEI